MNSDIRERKIKGSARQGEKEGEREKEGGGRKEERKKWAEKVLSII